MVDLRRLRSALHTGFAVVLIAPSAPAQGIEEGKSILAKFEDTEHGLLSRNWNIVRDQRGVLYVASRGGLFEYDGERWQLIEHPSGATIQSVALHRSTTRETVFVGASRDLGYLEPDAVGEPRFVSLRHHVPSHVRESGGFRHILATDAGVFFLSRHVLLRWHSGRMRAWPVPAGAKSAYRSLSFAHGRVVVARDGHGLYEVTGDNLSLITGSGPLKTASVMAVVPFRGGSLLAATFASGLFVVKDGVATEWNTAAGRFARGAQCSGVARVTDRLFVLSTHRAGALVFDDTGVRLKVLNKYLGLPSDVVLNCAYVEDESIVWLPLRRGIVRVSLRSPRLLFDESLGLEGQAECVHRHDGVLYVGTRLGLYVLRPARRRPQTARFWPIRGADSSCYDLVSVQGRLLAATRNGVYEVENHTLGKKADLRGRASDCMR